MRFVATGTIALAIAIGAIVATGGGGGGGGTANLWVDTNGGTCTRQSTPGAYVDAQACASLASAYDAASAGDSVLVKCGSYGSQTFDSSKGSGAQIVFAPETNFCVSFTGTSLAGVDFSGGGAYSTIQYFNISSSNDQGVAKGNSGSSSPSNVYVFHNHIQLDKAVNYRGIEIENAHNWKIDYNTIGPSCCGSGMNSPEGIRVSVASSGEDSTGLEIKNNLIQSVMRFCADWPSTYITVESSVTQSAGSCPSTDDSSAHIDGIHVWGLQSSVISNNQIYNVGCQGIFFEDTNGAINSANTLTSNAITTNSDNCNSGITIDARAGTHSLAGAWTISFNTANVPFGLDILGGGTSSSTTINMVGNLGSYFPTGNTGCGSFDSGTAVATFSYNAWITYGGAQNGTCGTGDVYPVSPTFVNSLFDLRLTGATTAADSLVPAATCTPITTEDAFGDTRPASGHSSFCDAGADER
jgi:hypothetical protein